MPVPTFEKPEEKEKNFLQKLLYTDLDTKTLDQAWKEYRYIQKHGVNKYLEEKERAEPGFMKKWQEQSPIGKILGRNHSTVHAIFKKVRSKILEDDFFQKQMKNILNEFEKNTDNKIPSLQKHGLRL